MTRKIKTEQVPQGLRQLPQHIKQEKTNDLTASCSLIPNTNSLLFSIQPPLEPEPSLKRASCDIVLVIDVSGSMFSPAPLPDVRDESESAGLSILDLVKHAALTILETLNEGDRLALITFSEAAKVVHDLIDMTPYNKKRMQRSIKKLTHDSSTNLWAGIKAGIDVFETASTRNNVQGMYILTDGMPNHLCPAQGYAPKLKPLLARLSMHNPQCPTIHTFGFGYDIRSGLLQTIAEIGLGSYAFIPDAGMIGTVFVHAVANLYTTYATQAVLHIQGADPRMIECPTVVNSSVRGGNTCVLGLGNLQYGQSRDIIARLPYANLDMVQAFLRFNDNSGQQREIDLSVSPTIAPDYQYHVFRSNMCEWLASLFPKLPNGEHKAITSAVLRGKQAYDSPAFRQMTDLATNMQQAVQDDGIESLLHDLVGDESVGQITQALEPKAWSRWGRHFLPSLLHAHTRQVCNSFKDPGPLQYGKDSPLFLHCRDQLDGAFENLPAPRPSRAHVTKGKLIQNVSMHRYHDCSIGCFAGDCLIRLADDSCVPVSDLRTGIKVWTPTGAKAVDAIIKTEPAAGCSRKKLVKVGRVWLTPWHPISHNGEWFFPNDVSDEAKPCNIPVYSILLAKSADSNSHAVEVGGEICVTLGHGIVDGVTSNDARAHAFFGNYRAVQHSLRELSKDNNGRYVTYGLKKDSVTGLTCGYLPVPKAFKVVKRKAALERRALSRSVLLPRECKLVA